MKWGDGVMMMMQRRLSVVLTAQNRGCAGCPDCLCSWPGWARAGRGATEPSWSTLGSFFSQFPPYLFPLFLLCALKRSPTLFPPPPPPLTTDLPGRADPHFSPAFLLQRGAVRSELIFHFLPFQSPSFPLFAPCSLSLNISACVSFFPCLRLDAWSSQLQRQTGQLPGAEDGAELEEAAEAGAEKSRCGTGRRGESARRRKRRPMQRWHI